MDRVAGGSNNAIGSGFGVELHGSYALPAGLSVNLGVHLGSHHIEGVAEAYRLQSLFIEPRLLLLRGARVAPYVSARFDAVREIFSPLRAAFKAGGYAVGGGGGAIVQLTPVVALDGGATVGTIRFRDYVVRPDFFTYNCLQALPDATTMPEAAEQCTTIVSPSPVYGCYPPFEDKISANCAPPEIPRPNTKRSGTWARVWLGLHLSLSNAWQ